MLHRYREPHHRQEKLRVPRDDADRLAILVEHGICPEELRDPLRSMAKSRDRLVHLYRNIDDRRVTSYLGDSLDNFDRFAGAVGAAFG